MGKKESTDIWEVSVGSAIRQKTAQLQGRMARYDWVQGRRRLAFALVCGLLCGLANIVLCRSVSWIGELWRAFPWMSALLPALGLLEIALYRALRLPMNLTPGFDGLIDSMKSRRRFPVREGIAVFLGTLMSLAGGASVGPDSASKHLGASVGTLLLPWFSLEEDDGEPAWAWACACGLTACFSALLCAPLGVFAYLVEHLRAHRIALRHLPTVLLSCLIGAAFARPLNLQIATPFVGVQGATPVDLWAVCLVAVACAVAGACFGTGVRCLELVRDRLGRSPMKCLLAGAALVTLALLLIPKLATWAGLGTQLVMPALAHAEPSWGFAYKLLLTIVCLGFGLRGGEVTIMFVVGPSRLLYRGPFGSQSLDLRRPRHGGALRRGAGLPYLGHAYWLRVLWLGVCALDRSLRGGGPRLGKGHRATFPLPAAYSVAFRCAHEMLFRVA